MTDTRTPEDIRATLQTLADEGGIHTVGRYVELAWSEGLLVTGGNHGDAEGLVLHAGQDDDCLTDDPAEVAEIDSDEISQPQGVHPDGPYYRPVLVVQAPRDPATVYAVIWAEMDVDTIYQHTADAAADEIATLRAEIARLTAIKDKAAETMRVWHKELTTLREEVTNLRELLGNYTGEEDNQPL